jgi:hypothetical protein
MVLIVRTVRVHVECNAEFINCGGVYACIVCGIWSEVCGGDDHFEVFGVCGAWCGVAVLVWSAGNLGLGVWKWGIWVVAGGPGGA